MGSWLIILAFLGLGLLLGQPINVLLAALLKSQQ